MKSIGILIYDITKGAGTERAVANLANILIKSNKVFIFSLLSETGNAKYQLDNRIQVLHINYKRSLNNKLRNLVYENKIIKSIIKKYSIDIVIGTDAEFNFILSSIKNVKTVGCEHFSYESNSKIHNFLSKILYKNLNKVILLTERDKNCYKKLKNTYVIPNSLSFIPTDTSKCTSKNIIAVGRLTYQKGFDLLLKACCKLNKSLNDWNVIIYGEGEDKEKLQSFIDSNSLNNFVTIKPFTSEIQKVYLDASIYVMTSRWEGLPMVLIEAQSCGLPIVAYDCPCGPSDVIVENKNGFLCKNGDEVSLITGIIKLANNPTLLQEMSKNAVELSKRYSTDIISEKWEKIIASL